MKLMGINLKDLYKTFDGDLEHGMITKETIDKRDYFYFYSNDGELIYCEGEECKVIDNRDFGYVLVNMDGEGYMKIILTQEEYDVGAFEICYSTVKKSSAHE